MAYIEMNGNMRILIADETAVDTQAMKQYLKRIGYTNVTHHPDGYSAIRAIRAGQADFVLCRMSLPVMDGPSVFEEMKSDFSIERVPFAMFEERMSSEDSALLFEYGVDGILSLPFVQKDLATMISNTWARYIDKANPEYLFEQGRRLCCTGHTAEAAKIFQALLQRKVHPHRALVGLGMVAKLENRLDDALSFAKEVTREHPEFVRGHHLMGEILLARGENVDAIAAFTKAIGISPKNPYRYEVVCELLEQLSLWAEAESLYRKALVLGLEFPSLKSGLAAALVGQSKWAEAISLYRDLVRAQPNNAAFLNNIATCYKSSGSLELAVDFYRRALELEPENTRVMFNLALAELKQGSVDVAKSLLANALRIDPKYEKARLKLDEIEGRRTHGPDGNAAEDREGDSPPSPEITRLQGLLASLRDGALSRYGPGIEMSHAERKLLLNADHELVKTAFHGLSTRTRRALVELVDGYFIMVATLSAEVAEILTEVSQNADVNNGGMSEGSVHILTALQFQDQLSQLLHGFRKCYREVVTKGYSLTEADFRIVVKGLPVVDMRQKLLDITSMVTRAPRDPFRDKELAIVEACELFALHLLEELAKGITESHQGLLRAVEAFRASQAGPEPVQALEGLAHHYSILATRLTTVRQILEFCMGCWLHADSEVSARQALLLFGRDLRGLWRNMESLCATQEERELLARAVGSFSPAKP